MLETFDPMQIFLNTLHVLKQKNSLIVIVVFLVAVVNVMIFYGIAYSRVDTPGIPLGWDTPNYVIEIKDIRAGNISHVVEREHGITILYSIVASIIPLSPLGVEIYFPIFLAILTVISVGVFSYALSRNLLITCSSVLFASAWFALYRITSDLHAQLFSLPLLFFAFSIFLSGRRGKMATFVPALILISSFSHFETTILLTTILTGTMVIIYGRKQISRLLILVILPLIPSSIAYYLQITSTLILDATQITHEPAANTFLTRSMNLFWPFVIFGVLFCLYLIIERKKFQLTEGNLRFMIFAMLWLVLSIVIFYADYVDNSLRNYSVRAAVLLPVPFIASLPFFITTIPALKQKATVAISVLAIGILIAASTYANLSSLIQNELPISNRIFLSAGTFSRIESLQDNQFEEMPIFIYYPSGESPGGVATQYEDWITAIFGAHFSYLGSLDLLLNAQETQFDDSVSKVVSHRYINSLKEHGLWNSSSISARPIVIIQEFYRAKLSLTPDNFVNIGDNTLLYIDKIQDGKKIRTYDLDTLPSSTSGWYSRDKEFDGVKYHMLETYVDANNVKPLNFILPLENKCHILTLKYQDASKGLGFQISANKEIPITVNYDGSGTLNKINFDYCGSGSTEFILTPIADLHSSSKRFVSIEQTLQIATPK